MELGKKSHAKLIFKMTIFYDIKIKMCPHKFLNYSQGVVKCKELPCCTLKEKKKSQKPASVRRKECPSDRMGKQ